MAKFIYSDIDAYSVKIDFNDLQGCDIPKSVRYTIESLITLKKN